MAPSDEKYQQDMADQPTNPSISTIAISSQDAIPAKAAIFNTPQELLDIICKIATARDVGALRATCKQLQEKIEKTFREITFSTIEIHLDSRHLTFLKAVSTSRFAACVKVVHIRPRYAPFQTMSNTEQDEFIAFHNNENDVNWLAEALCAFPNLARLEVEASSTPALQTSLAEDAVRNCRIFTGPSDGTIAPSLRNKGISYAFQIALLAMDAMKTQNKSVPELRAGTIPDGILRKSVDHMSIKLDDPSQYEGLAQLSALQLVLEVKQSTIGLSRELHLADLLDHTPRLKKLKLSFWYMADDWLTNTFISVNLPQLSTLEVEAAHGMDVLELRDFLERHTPTLRHLELKNITFRNNVVVDVLSDIFISGELILHSIKLQQLCNSRSGLLLFGEDADLRVCETCDQDRNAAWLSEVGPGCVHGTLAAEGEVEVKKELERVKEMGVLPWAPVFAA